MINREEAGPIWYLVGAPIVGLIVLVYVLVVQIVNITFSIGVYLTENHQTALFLFASVLLCFFIRSSIKRYSRKVYD